MIKELRLGELYSKKKKMKILLGRDVDREKKKQSI